MIRSIRNYLDKDVLIASRERISYLFDNFEKICVSFSGGKDSTIMLHLTMDEAIKRNQKIGVLFLDWECQFTDTVNHVKKMFALYENNIEPYWLCIPITTWNGCSQFEPEWTCWDTTKKELWVRRPDNISITDPSIFPFYNKNMTFEEFMPEFAKWYSQGKMTVSLIGLRCGESLSRWLNICAKNENKPHYKNQQSILKNTDNNFTAYPLYDWTTEDDWVYFAKSGKQYNRLYDKMYQSGMTIHQMRIDEPFGSTQRVSLWLYHILEPELWAKMVYRVAGVNAAGLYCKERGNVLGNHQIKLPLNHTWKSFAFMLLNTMPNKTAEHYKNKIAVYLTFWEKELNITDIPDFQENDMGSKDIKPSWRRICKSLLRNDYWCIKLGFSPTKTSAYTHYLEIMKKRRETWNII
jgi:predicted phosphoadenosine phosphosulfate sulfurtransferase